MRQARFDYCSFLIALNLTAEAIASCRQNPFRVMLYIQAAVKGRAYIRILRGLGLVVQPHGFMVIAMSQLVGPECCLASDMLSHVPHIFLVGILIHLYTGMYLRGR